VAGSVLGEKVLRKEDPKFLTTGGVYIDDFTDPRLDGAVAGLRGDLELIGEQLVLAADRRSV